MTPQQQHHIKAPRDGGLRILLPVSTFKAQQLNLKQLFRLLRLCPYSPHYGLLKHEILALVPANRNKVKWALQEALSFLRHAPAEPAPLNQVDEVEEQLERDSSRVITPRNVTE